MKIILLLWSLGVCQAQIFTPFRRSTVPQGFTFPPGFQFPPSRQKVVTGSMDNMGICHCSLAIPDVMFPVERMAFLEKSNLNLSLRFQKEIIKIQSYQYKLNIYQENIRNLTNRVEFCHKAGVSENQLDFGKLKLEISELESLVIKLRSSLTGSNEKVEILYLEIKNISVMVNQLEIHDKNNILKARREIASLQKRVNECQQSDSSFHMQFDTCKHGRIVNISKPQVVQVNWRGISYKIGGWGKDSFLGSTQELYWVLSSDNSYYFNSVRFYPNFNYLKQYKNATERAVSVSGRGSGLTLYNNALYYNCYSRDICKFNLDTNKLDRKTLPNAAYNNRFPYASSQNQDIDLEGDERGLWVLHTKEDARGSMVIGLLNETSLDLIRTWTTSVYKPSVTNAFMVCGVMYATRAINTREEEIFYIYDTNTGTEHYVKIKFDKILENIHSLSYNANDHKLYMYNDGFQVIYNIHFKPLA